MTPITRESARMAVAELPVSGRDLPDVGPFCETALERLAEWLSEQLDELETRYEGYRTRSSVRTSILGQDRSRGSN